MSESLYSRRSNLIIGFHGTTKDRADKILGGSSGFRISNKVYDWLGKGMYFWENNYRRAEQWAFETAKKEGKGDTPAVVGAVLDLGFCLDLTDSKCLDELKEGYNVLKESFEKDGRELPKNSLGGSSSDLLLRNLDCAVINSLHELRKVAKMPSYDSVRGVFWEGEDLYKGAGFKAKNHIQIAIINPNCIKGFFRPRNINKDYNNV